MIMKITVNIVDTLFDSIPKGTVVANYVTEVDTVNFKMYSTVYSIDETNKAIVTTKKVDANNLEAIHFDAINWVTTDKATIDNIYPKVVSKYQNKFKKEGVIYKITKDYDLNNCILTIPANCTLDFQGGSFSNGTIVGNNTKIVASKVSFKKNIKLSGSFVGDIRSSWFEIDSTDCTDTLENIFNISEGNNVIIEEGTYNVSVKNLPREEGGALEHSIFILKSNSTVTLNGTIKLAANDKTHYQIFRLYNIHNTIVQGTGSIIGDLDSHTGTTGEWGHGVGISSSQYITVRDITISKCWGDGLSVSTYDADNLSYNITIDNILATHNRRLGVSIISGDGIKFINSTTRYNGSSRGTSPSRGLDIEPDPGNTLNNVLVDNCLIRDRGLVHIPITDSVNDTKYSILIQNCSIPSQFDISGACTFKGNRIKYLYINNARHAEILNNHIYENLIFGGNKLISNVNIKGNNITPLNGEVYNYAIVFGETTVKLENINFIDNIIDLTKQSKFKIIKGLPETGKLDLRRCTIITSKTDPQLYYTAGDIINCYIEAYCFNFYENISVENSTINLIGNTFIFYRTYPFVINIDITTPYTINILHNDIITPGFEAKQLIAYMGHTFAGTINVFANNYDGLETYNVGNSADMPTLNQWQKGEQYFAVDYNRTYFWNGDMWVDGDGYKPLKRVGTTAERPVINFNTFPGFQYFDTSLSKYICWNGKTWTNLDGTALN